VVHFSQLISQGGFMADRTPYYDTGAVFREIITHPHEKEGVFHAHTRQTLDPVLSLAEQMRDQNEVIGHRKSAQMVPVAEIPMIVWERAAREGWLHDKKKWREWINDPQNKPFRITEGRI
jgi:hypothetical protein